MAYYCTFFGVLESLVTVFQKYLVGVIGFLYRIVQALSTCYYSGMSKVFLKFRKFRKFTGHKCPSWTSHFVMAIFALAS